MSLSIWKKWSCHRLFKRAKFVVQEIDREHPTGVADMKGKKDSRRVDQPLKTTSSNHKKYSS